MTLKNDFSSIRQWDNENFIHPWERMAHIGKNQRTFTESSRGIYLTTETGKRLIDGSAGKWCVQIDYGP
ncbi:hypothetical protein HW561_10605 [Rhodobacteraceae bacterium B1Z28]|uniref:Uncharacterized protein n=1 Tax=Ruegeria haliotis TaxID=2747601 RepID=A0ABX2PR60_9RHOB|nr:hypothetical protein [Ruegeria haliotis]NVO56240.1 hypothetical protein [Ruegeria haliotis]